MLVPLNTCRQEITDVNIDISNVNKYYTTKDNFGNHKFYGEIIQSHNSFSVLVSGVASTGLEIYEEYTQAPSAFSLFKYQTAITYPLSTINSYHKSLNLQKFNSDYEKAIHIMRAVYTHFKYVTGSTQIHATAEEALKLGEGVCQDYAHIMLSLLRIEGIPCRYVVGIMQGEGASHAWTEVLCNGYWYGFDPTNNKLVDDEYIKISCGRDSGDCAVIRGIFRGLAEQIQTELVVVEEL